MQELNLMYLFTFTVYASTEKQAAKKIVPLRNKCSQFAKSIDSLVMCDTFGFFDDSLAMRMVFNIKGSQESVLPKVSALFAFATVQQITFINQEFLSK
ncbi:MAG: hypothetical protein ACRCY5_07160 [Phocaeicola sp.]